MEENFGEFGESTVIRQSFFFFLPKAILQSGMLLNLKTML